MHKNYRTGNRLYCFSPPVMLATFCIEITMALYTLLRYKLNTLGRLVVATFVMLATFQLSEYFVCGGAGLSAMHWSRLGYAAITTLPPLGLHMMHVLAHKKTRKLVLTAYITMAGFIVYFLAIPTAFRNYQCTGNYVIFQLGERASLMYGAYYYSWLFAAIGLGMRWLGEFSAHAKELLVQRRLIQSLIIGYMVFLVPTAIANSIDPETRRGIPSIMCGFAVLFAFILAFYILPRAGTARRKALDKLA